MIDKNRSAVVIPVYKPFNDLTATELLSLKSTCKYLHQYPHVLVGPENFQWNEYLSFFHSFKVRVITLSFDGFFFNNIEGYNRLLISSIFYKKFKSFKYILVFQLDAYVFSDELQLWCDKGYDYIGAPWFEGYDIVKSNKIIGVGNGGFSLRNVKDSIKLLKKLRLLEALEPYKNFNWKGIVPRLNSIIRRVYGAKKRPCDFERNFNLYEDIFWCKAAPLRLNSFSCNSAILQLMATIFLKDTFKIAPIEDAVKFSFETNPREMFKMNNEQLPFGCHAWEKYDPEFWKKFIPGITSNELNNA